MYQGKVVCARCKITMKLVISSSLDGQNDTAQKYRMFSFPVHVFYGKYRCPSCGRTVIVDIEKR